jgi:hypothetical protein
LERQTDIERATTAPANHSRAETADSEVSGISVSPVASASMSINIDQPAPVSENAAPSESNAASSSEEPKSDKVE